MFTGIARLNAGWTHRLKHYSLLCAVPSWKLAGISLLHFGREKLVKAYITAAGVEGMPLPAQLQLPGMPSVIPSTGKNKSMP